jgi:hypothetical protein
MSDPVVVEGADVGSVQSGLGRRLMAWFALLLPPLLAGHALFDRGFAYLGVPHTPAYVTEMVMALGLTAVLCLPHPFRLAFERSPVPAGILVALMLWGGGHALVQLPSYGLVTIRDYALIYYMIFAFLTAAVLTSQPGWLDRLVRSYRRFIPWLFAWSPVVIIVATIQHDVGPLVPGTPVPLLAHRIGDLQVQLGVAIAFLWLVPSVATNRQRRAYTLVGALLLAAAGTQGRGGLVAAGVILAIALVIAGQRRHGVGGLAAALLVLVILLALINPQVHLSSQRRTLSFHQLTENVSTIVGGKGTGDLNDTVEWRSDLWKEVISKTISQGKGLLGWGFGPNLGTQFAFGQVDVGGLPLRSPHNSTVDLIARTGPVGGLLWIALWVTWIGALVRRRADCLRRGDTTAAGLIEVLILAAVASLINAYFDPALEAAPAAVFLWVVVGLGLTAPWGRGAPSDGSTIEQFDRG